MEKDIIAEIKQLVDSEMYDEARELLYNVIKENPEDVNAHNKLGILMARQKQYEEAKKHFRKAFELEPEKASAVCNLGNVYYETGDLDKAEQYYKKASEVDPDNPLPYNNLAVIYKRKKKTALYINHYKKYMGLRLKKEMTFRKAEQREIRKVGFFTIIAWLVGLIIMLTVFKRFR
jgi:tetratricopeptide (TPR) repeat protein